MKQRAAIWAGCAGLGLSLLSLPAAALPGFFATAGGEASSRASHVVVMKNGDQSVVSITTDYAGPMDKFAWVIPVPADVDASSVITLKRVDVERLEQLTAPRFHEFWEMDPCEPGKPEQIWEMDLSASEATDFLGAGEMLAGTTKAPPEMRIEVEPEFRRDSEYAVSVVGSNLESFLKGKGLQVPGGVPGKLSGYSKFIVAEVDSRKVELGSKGEAMLSPLRYATKQNVPIATSLGAPHIKGHHELLIYVLDPEKRYEVKNHPNEFPPTNFQVDFEAKERTAELYAAIHDKMLAKNKDAFLVEYAWSTKGCGEPCPNARLHLAELLTLGGDVHEQNVSPDLRNPDPPERSEEEQAIYDALKPDEKKQKDDLAKEVARRKALIERQSDYMLTRLHHRYSEPPSDVELGPAEHVKGGVEVPKGASAELPVNVTPAETSTLQTRIVNLHPSKVVINCEAPERYRWGRPPKSFRGARKIWVADGLAFRDRGKVKLDELIHTPIPALGIAGVTPAAEQAASAAKAKEEAANAEDCDCASVGVVRPGAGGVALLGFGLLGLLGRRRNRAKFNRMGS